jgi:DNA-binding PadR family transcriptional regulator
MEKKLLLLGLLRREEMHGYQLNEILTQAVGMPIRLSKGNAYKLLKTMAADGWVKAFEEQAGNRPVRRVYRVTAVGEAAFQRLLRDSLATAVFPEFPNFVSLNFIDELPADEAADLLQQRRRELTEQWQRFNSVDEEIRRAHPTLDLLYRYCTAELSWIDELIDRLASAST